MASLAGRVALALGVEPGERQSASLMLGHSFAMGLATVFFETAASALFLAHFGSEALPYVYIVAAVLNTATGLLYTSVQARLSFATLMQGTLAPGAAISAAGRGGGTSTFLGTSQASPHAAGAAALLLQARPDLSPGQIEAALKSTGAPITDPKNGLSFKRIDVKSALDLARTF